MYFSDNHIKNRSHLQAFCSSMAILELRVSPIIRIKPAESLYGATRWPKCFWKCLRKFRKSKRERFGACGTPANQKENVLALAEVPQIKKRTFWRLRDSRKSKKERFGACGSSASISKTLAVTALYPSHSSGIRSPIHSFKLTLQRFLEREIRRRGHPFRSDRSLVGHTLLRSISEVPI